MSIVLKLTKIRSNWRDSIANGKKRESEKLTEFLGERPDKYMPTKYQRRKMPAIKLAGSRCRELPFHVTGEKKLQTDGWIIQQFFKVFLYFLLNRWKFSTAKSRFFEGKERKTGWVMKRGRSAKSRGRSTWMIFIGLVTASYISDWLHRRGGVPPHSFSFFFFFFIFLLLFLNLRFA